MSDKLRRLMPVLQVFLCVCIFATAVMAAGFVISTSYPVTKDPQTLGTKVFPLSIAVADFNNDGNLDVAVGGSPGINLLLGNGDGTFQSAIESTNFATPIAMAVADFNGKGALDIAAANYLTGTASVLPGNGDGSFGLLKVYPVSTFAAPVQSIAEGDLNGDGLPDFAVTSGNGTSGQVTVLLNRGSGSNVLVE